jgi:ABC-type Na+ efflux pump permease subunit
MEGSLAVLIMALLAIFSLFFYFLPSIAGRRKRNAGAIFILNLLLGWTFIGWVVALVWALCKDPEPVKQC